ncbi:MAG TPA: hypothetical protein VJ140_05070 [Actinomycetota bacterium]|nr:hypothetical protein [Actinomycetota bacterium]
MADIPQAETNAAQAETNIALATAVGDLAKSIEGLDQAIGKIDRRGRRNTWFGGGAMVAVLAVAIVGTSATFERNDRAEQSRTILEAISQSQETIKGCTSPGHPCYDENQVRSNARLAPIIAVICKGIPEADRQSEPLCRRPG